MGCGSGGAEDAAAPLQPHSLRCRCRAPLPAPCPSRRGSSHPQDLGRNHTVTSSTAPNPTAQPSLLTVCHVVETTWRGEEETAMVTSTSPPPPSPPSPPTPGPPDSPETISRATATNASAPNSSLLALSPSSLPSSCITRRGMGAGGGVPAGGWWWTCRRRSPSTSSSLLVQLPSSSSGSGEGWGTVGRAHRLALLLGAPPRTPHGADLQCDPQHAAPAQCCASPAPSCPRH